MKKSPSDKELATFYAAKRNGDSSEQARKMLNLSKSQIHYWKEKGGKAIKKKREGYYLDKDEKDCLHLLKLIKAADRRRRGWTN